MNRRSIHGIFFSCAATTLPDTKSLLPKKIARIITKICLFLKLNSFFIDKLSCQGVKKSAWWKRRSAECGARSTEYGVRSADYGVRSRECAESVSVKVFLLDLAAIFKQTPSFPLYGGIKWKTRSLSLKCFFRFDGDF